MDYGGKDMKKMLVLLLAAGMMLGLSACGSSAGKQEEKGSEVSDTETDNM